MIVKSEFISKSCENSTNQVKLHGIGMYTVMAEIFNSSHTSSQHGIDRTTSESNSGVLDCNCTNPKNSSYQSSTLAETGLLLKQKKKIVFPISLNLKMG